MDRKLLLIILDGVPYANWRRYFGNLEGWVASGEARVWRMRAVLPSTSACCYASIHTGVSPQVHGVTSNETIFRLSQPDIFGQVRKAGGDDRRRRAFLLVGILQPRAVRLRPRYRI